MTRFKDRNPLCPACGFGKWNFLGHGRTRQCARCKTYYAMQAENLCPTPEQILERCRIIREEKGELPDTAYPPEGGKHRDCAGHGTSAIRVVSVRTDRRHARGA